MSKVTYCHSGGAETTLEAEKPTSLMHLAVTNDVPGIVGECGGNAMCATCHVYVADADLDRLAVIEEDEDEMLDGTAAPRTERSRLSCQLVLDERLDGIVVEVPAAQL